MGVDRVEWQLLVAKQAGRIVGTVQRHLAAKPNARHRAEVAKLLVHPDVQRRSIGRRLMLAVEQAARREQRSLLVLDTRLGDGSNDLCHALGYSECGRIPGYARSASGRLDTTVLFYKSLDSVARISSC